MALYRITHPLADEISVQDSEYHYCRPGMSSEIAFFLKGQWVVEPIPDFGAYHDGGYGDTAVYSYVPNELIRAFLVEHDAEPMAESPW